jgi:hypothetical protein
MKRPLGIFRRRWQDVMKIDLTELVFRDGTGLFEKKVRPRITDQSAQNPTGKRRGKV